MKTITFKAKSGSVCIGDDREPTPAEMLELDGIDCQDNFAEYSDLTDKLKSGYMEFKVEDGVLYTITKYNVTEELTDDEIEQLKDETQGQWSDGIGEGFEQYPCSEIEGEEVFISPWYYGQTIETIIE
jgi:hypothetical protein